MESGGLVGRDESYASLKTRSYMDPRRESETGEPANEPGPRVEA